MQTMKQADLDFVRAKDIARIACSLDWLKNVGTPEQMEEAKQSVEQLHDIAQALAGERCDELYSTRKVRDDLIAYIRRNMAAGGPWAREAA